jgi:hypothetical protein
MKGNTILGLVAGLAAGIAATVAVNKVVTEIKSDIGEHRFTSPNGNNFVTLSYGSSNTAKGLTCIKVNASKEGFDDNCKLMIFAKKNEELFTGEWTDNDNFTLWVGKGKRKWRCEVDFEGEGVSAELYLDKEEKVAEAVVEAAADVETEAEVDVEEIEEN